MNKLAGFLTSDDTRGDTLGALDQILTLSEPLIAGLGTTASTILGYVGIFIQLLSLKGDEPDSAKLYRNVVFFVDKAISKADSFLSTLRDKIPNDYYAPMWFDVLGQPSVAKKSLKINQVYDWVAVNVASDMSFTKRPWGLFAKTADAAKILAQKLNATFDGWSDTTGFVTMQQYSAKCGTSTFKIWYDYKKL